MNLEGCVGVCQGEETNSEFSKKSVQVPVVARSGQGDEGVWCK